MGNGQGIARVPLCPASVSKTTVKSHTMAVESWAHVGDRKCRFRAQVLTSVWLVRLERRAKDRRWDALTVSCKEACEISIGNGPEGAHAPAHRRYHRPS